jgi:hypothetical protein
MNDIDRIAAKDYVPSDQDVFHAVTETPGINETTLQAMGWRIFDVSGKGWDRIKWIPFFGAVSADYIFFVLDLNDCNQDCLDPSARVSG